MINALYEPFPESITVEGIEYPIITDFREWFRFADMAADKDIDDKNKILLMTQWLLDIPDRITGELINAIIGFYKAKALEPDMPEYEDEDTEEEPLPTPPVLSWKIDAPYIIGDFQRYYGIDLLTAEMHWWEFRCLFASLPEDSACQKRIAYRAVDLSKIKSNAERQLIMEIQRRIAIPYEMTDDEISAVFEV